MNGETRAVQEGLTSGRWERLLGVELTDPEERDFDEASSNLNKGLRSCRAVISGYRSLLRREADNDEDGLDDGARLSND